MCKKKWIYYVIGIMIGISAITTYVYAQTFATNGSCPTKSIGANPGFFCYRMDTGQLFVWNKNNAWDEILTIPTNGFVSLSSPILNTPTINNATFTNTKILYDYQTRIDLQDDFMFGSITSGNLGNLGWAVVGGISYIGNVIGRPGVIVLDTGGTINTLARLIHGIGFQFRGDQTPYSFTWILRINTNDANTTSRIGSTDTFANNPPTNGIYFEKLAADTNWFCVARASGVQTRVDSGVATTTNFTKFTGIRNIASATFMIDNNSVCNIITTDLPIAFMGFSLLITNTAAASKTMDIDYFEGSITGLSR